MDRVIENVCDEFEKAWQNHRPVRIEELLARSDTGRRDELLHHLICLELELRQKAGETPKAGDYHVRFPEDTSLIDAAFAAVASLQSTKPPSVPDPYATTKMAATTSMSTGDTSDRHQATAPRQIGRYTVLGELGRGGQADVFRAVHPTLPMEVAIKLTHATLEPGARDALREEAHILCDLDHPHIARVRDFDFVDGRPFMVLDFIRGRSLAQVADAEPLTPQAAARMVAKLARAIGFAHSRGVIHRDLKPENVVIGADGEPKIIDFGMSRLRTGIAGAVLHVDEISGTLVYMSPEQAAGVTSRTDHRADIFALGAILYRLLVGKSPYPTLPEQQLYSLVRRGEWNREALESGTAPEYLKDVCRKALAMDAQHRYPNATELAEVLEQFGTPTIPVAPIKSFELIHIGNSTNKAEFSGRLMQHRTPRENDDIQVRAEFNVSVYCYLIAFNPDGVKQLCYPSDASIPQAKPVSSLRYPETETSAFGLTDGSGQQAFVLYASSDPLPAYDSWSSELTAAEWPNPEVNGNWFYDRGELVALSAPPRSGHSQSTRGIVRKTKTPTPFKQLCDQLRATQSGDVLGMLFEVEPGPL